MKECECVKCKSICQSINWSGGCAMPVESGLCKYCINSKHYKIFECEFKQKILAPARDEYEATGVIMDQLNGAPFDILDKTNEYVGDDTDA